MTLDALDVSISGRPRFLPVFLVPPDVVLALLAVAFPAALVFRGRGFRALRPGLGPGLGLRPGLRPGLGLGLGPRLGLRPGRRRVFPAVLVMPLPGPPFAYVQPMPAPPVQAHMRG